MQGEVSADAAHLLQTRRWRGRRGGCRLIVESGDCLAAHSCLRLPGVELSLGVNLLGGEGVKFMHNTALAGWIDVSPNMADCLGVALVGPNVQGSVGGALLLRSPPIVNRSRREFQRS